MKKTLSLLFLCSAFFSTHTKPATPIAKKKNLTKKIEDPKQSHVITVTADTFEKLILKSKTPVLVDVYADWCNPCLRMAPIFEEVAQKFKGKKITFAKIKVESFEDSEQNIKLLKDKLDASITMIPTFLYIEKGKVVEKIVGSQNSTILNSKIAKLMSPISNSTAKTAKLS